MAKKKQDEISCVVKRRKNDCTPYDERKVYGSVYAACYVVRMHEEKCEDVADKVATKVTKWVKKKDEVDSTQIAEKVTKELKKHNKHAAFMYDTHRDIA